MLFQSMNMDHSISSFFYRGRDPRQTFAFDRILYSDKYHVQVTPIGISVGHGYRRNVIDIDKILRVEDVPGAEMRRRKHTGKWIRKIYRTCFPRRPSHESRHIVAVHLYDGNVHSLRAENPDDLMHAITNARSAVY